MIRLALLALLAGCARDAEYQCTSDEQCDLGEAGRCELDGRCTAHDLDCPSTRRYTEHSGALTGTCFDDAIVPRNACAEGQPPAQPVECFAEVCAAIPACCSTGWSAACVQQAQLVCPELRCDTRIAITASFVDAGGMTVTQVWDLRTSDGAIWTFSPLVGSAVAWLAPARNGTEPRLARLEPGRLVVDEIEHPLTERSYTEVASVDLERTGRDTVVLGSFDPAIVGSAFLDVLDLERETRRELTFEESSRIEWGDLNHDAFPDAVVASDGVGYVLATNVEDATHQRVFSPTGRAAMSGQRTQGQDPEVRGIAWTDLDENGALDLVVAGSSIRVHVARGSLVAVNDMPQVSADCHPIATTGIANCNAGNPVGSNASSFTLAAVPRLDGTEIAIAAFPQLEATALEITNVADVVTPSLTPIEIPEAASCPTCPPLVALAARDLDHDGVLDLIGIDQTLGVWTRIAPATVLTRVVPGSLIAFTAVRLSVSGAPLP